MQRSRSSVPAEVRGCLRGYFRPYFRPYLLPSFRSWPRVIVMAGVLCAAGMAAPGATAPAAATADAPGAPAGPCALQRTDAWLSEGVTPWDTDHVRPDGTIKAKMIFVRFPGHTPARTPRQLGANYLPSVPQFYARASYGKARLVIDPVLTYVTAPEPATAYGIHRAAPYRKVRRYIHDVVAAAGRSGVNFRGVRTLYIVADPEAPGVDHDATATTTLARRDAITADDAGIRNVSAIWESAAPDRNVVTHETGHLFGLPDLYVEPDHGSLLADWDRKVGDWDLMGDQRAIAPEFLAWEKWKFGWLDAGQVDCVAEPGVTVHTVTPTEIPGGTKLVVVKRSDTDAYALEVRSHHGNDSATCAEGVLLYHVRTDIGSTHGPIQVRNAHPGSVGSPDSLGTPGSPGPSDPSDSSDRSDPPGSSGSPGAANCGRAQEPTLVNAPFRVGESYTADHGHFRLQVLSQDAHENYRIQVTAPAPQVAPVTTDDN